MCLAAFFFGLKEGWTVTQSIYYTTVTITTVGYGDFSPSSNWGKVVGIFYILFGLAKIFTIVAGVALDVIAEAEKRALDAADDDPTDNKKPHGAKIAMSVGAIIFCVFFGAIVFFAMNEFKQESANSAEQFLNCFWWSFVTLTTVGYGDLSYTRTPKSHVFSIFFILFSVLVASVAIGNISSVSAEMAKEKREEELLERLDFNMLVEMDTDGDGIDENEYVIGMLQLLELVDEEKITMLREQFSEHDKDGSGRLDRTDLAIIAKEKDLEKFQKKLALKGVSGEHFRHAVEEYKKELEARDTPVSPKAAKAAEEGKAELPPTDGSVELMEVVTDVPAVEDEQAPRCNACL